MSKPSLLPSGMRLVGDVQGDEDFVIFGTVEGEVNVGGSVVVEATGTVRGNVRGRTVAVRGIVVGDASASESIRVEVGSRMVGDVHAPRVNIVKGARFRGQVHMTQRATGERDGREEVSTRMPYKGGGGARAAPKRSRERASVQ